MSEYNLTHLKQLEAESIHIIREVAAEFDKPVMLYSIGKDSSVMLHLALKAFYPGKPPFPLMHVDTTWKFREMIDFRDQQIEKLGLNFIDVKGIWIRRVRNNDVLSRLIRSVPILHLPDRVEPTLTLL